MLRRIPDERKIDRWVIHLSLSPLLAEAQEHVRPRRQACGMVLTAEDLMAATIRERLTRKLERMQCDFAAAGFRHLKEWWIVQYAVGQILLELRSGSAPSTAAGRRRGAT